MSQHSLTEPLRETLAVFDSTGTPQTTTEVADCLDLGRRSTYNRLDRLVDVGPLETKKVGASARVWWRPTEAGADEPGEAPDWAGVTHSLVDDVLDRADAGIFVLDDEFEVRWINEATERYFGLDREAVVGRDKRWLVEERVAPVVEDSALFAERVLSTYEDNTDPEQFACRVTPGAGREERWLEHRSKPIESGAYSGGRVELYYDVSELRRSEERHQHDRTKFESLVEAVEEYAIFLLDTEGRVESWNPGAARLKGYEADEILGRHFSTFYTDEDCAAGVPEENLEAAAANGWTEDEGWRVRKDGSRFWANVTLTAVRDEDGHLEGYAKVTRDMTDRREYEQRLLEERDVTRKILETAPASIFVVDPSGSVVEANDRVREELGLDEVTGTFSVDDIDVYDESGAPVPPDERPYRTAFETGEAVTDWQCQVELPSGDRQWVTLNVRPIADSAGEIDRVVVAAQDVTYLKEQERQLTRQRDELEHELDEVFDRVDDAFLALDDDWRLTHVNEQAATLLDRTVGELVGNDVWVEFPEAVGTFREQFERALETGETTTFEEYYPPLAAWFEVNVYPSETGLSVYFRDVTAGKRREQELERYETVLEESRDVNVIVDEDGTYEYVTPSMESVLGHDPADILGENAFDYVHPADRERVFESFVELLENPQLEPSVEYRFRRADGSWAVLESRGRNLLGEPEVEGVVVYSRDVTERKRRERDLERYETIVETVEDGIYVVDQDGYFTEVNETYERMVGESREELLGAHVSRVIEDDEVLREAERLEEELSEGTRSTASLEAELESADGETRIGEATFALMTADDGYERVGVVRDVTERKERERELAKQVAQQEVVTDLGQRALADRDLDALLAEAAALVADTLDTDYCKVLDLDPEAEELLLRQGVGWDEGVVGTATVSAVEDDSQAAHTLQVDEPVVVTDLDSERRFDGPTLLTSHDVTSGISTVVGTPAEPWGILGAHDTARREFSEHDVNFVQTVATILASAISRREDERELQRQREQLAALNSLHETVREITGEVIEQSTREEIEAAVCENLADSNSYLFAWVGEVDLSDETVVVQTQAGVEGYLDDITISVDPDDPRSQGPTGRALRTGEVQTTRDIDTDDRHDPWRDHLEQYDFQSSSAIPIVHEGTVYGVLNVYAGRPGAFEGWELTVLAQVGEVVGHAIAATERKRALLGDEVVELEFRIEDVFESLGLDADASGPIELEQTVPVEDDAFVVYGRTTDAGVRTVETMVAEVPFYEEVTFRDLDEGTRFELRVSDPPVLSVVASLGGSVEEAVIEDGDYRLRIHLPPSADVPRVVTAMTETYPDANLLKRRQLERHEERTPDAATLAADLTDRQRTALEVAFHAGFFEWPRDATGEDVAATLDIAAPTFHYHLRRAERKVVGSFVQSSPVADE